MVCVVQAVINIDEKANRVLNIVEAKHGLKDKSQAINKVVFECEEAFLEPELRPDYKERIDKISEGKHFSKKHFLEEVL